MAKHLWSSNTWRELEDRLQDPNLVVLVPVGTVETQGLHAPTGYDFIVAEALANEVAKRSGQLAAPGIAYGFSSTFTNYPGTLSLRPETLKAMMEDIVEGLIAQGVSRIFFVNNHQPNQPAFEQVARATKQKYGVSLTSIQPARIARAFAMDQFENPEKTLSHGGEPMSSLLTYLCGEDMRMDLARKGTKHQHWGPFTRKSVSAIDFKGFEINAFFNIEEVFPTGGYGEIVADGKKGEVIFNRMVEYLADFVKEFAAMALPPNPRVPKPPKQSGE